MLRHQTFSAESATEGQPDKLCDLLVDTILDEVLEKDRFGRVSIDCMAAPGLVLLAGQISTKTYVDITGVLRRTIQEVGYDDPQLHFEARSIAVLTLVEEQSEDIALTVDQRGAGNSCISVGYATNECEKMGYDSNLMPLPIFLAHKLAKQLTKVRKDDQAPFLYPDGNVMVTLQYEENVPSKLLDCTICAQHHEDISIAEVRNRLTDLVIAPMLEGLSSLNCDECKVRINPYSTFIHGGPLVDIGVSGRKSISDTYGTVCPYGGSSLSGKDPTKTDRASVYMARYIAKNLVTAGVADRIEVRLVYHFGSPSPVSVQINTYGKRIGDERDIEEAVLKQFDLTSPGIIDKLRLFNVRYAPISCYGHLGRTDITLPWEKTDAAASLAKALT